MVFGPMAVHGEETGSSAVSHREPGEVMHTPGTVSIGNQPPWGGGAYFAAGVETSPPPLSPQCRLAKNRTMPL